MQRRTRTRRNLDAAKGLTLQTWGEKMKKRVWDDGRGRELRGRDDPEERRSGMLFGLVFGGVSLVKHGQQAIAYANGSIAYPFDSHSEGHG